VATCSVYKEQERKQLILVTIGGVNDGLQQAAGLGEEGLSSLLGSGVGANAADDVDSLQVAAVDEQVHARHYSALDVAGDGDVQHSLASLVTDHADKVESDGGGSEAQLEGIEDDTGLGSKLKITVSLCDNEGLSMR
jgi:hypothetical protein